MHKNCHHPLTYLPESPANKKSADSRWVEKSLRPVRQSRPKPTSAPQGLVVTTEVVEMVTVHARNDRRMMREWRTKCSPSDTADDSGTTPGLLSCSHLMLLGGVTRLRCSPAGAARVRLPTCPVSLILPPSFENSCQPATDACILLRVTSETRLDPLAQPLDLGLSQTTVVVCLPGWPSWPDNGHSSIHYFPRHESSTVFSSTGNITK